MFKIVRITLMLLLSINVGNCLAIDFVSPFELYANYRKIIFELSKNFDNATVDEKNFDERAGGGSSVYGELEYASGVILLDYLKLTPNDVFIDLGSGFGNWARQVFFTSLCREVIGVELVKKRYESANGVVKEAKAIYNDAQKLENEMRSIFGKKQLPKVKNKSIKFINESFFDVDFSNATVAYTCSTCFSDQCMKDLVAKINDECKDGFRFLTLRKLDEPENMHLVKVFQLPMTWTSKTPVYVYVLDRKKKHELEAEYDPFGSIEENDVFIQTIKKSTEEEKAKEKESNEK